MLEYNSSKYHEKIPRDLFLLHSGVTFVRSMPCFVASTYTRAPRMQHTLPKYIHVLVPVLVPVLVLYFVLCTWDFDPATIKYIRGTRGHQWPGFLTWFQIFKSKTLLFWTNKNMKLSIFWKHLLAWIFWSNQESSEFLILYLFYH